jgi:N-carbamoylputrescine amidase
MRVTVCQLSSHPDVLPGEWDALVKHVEVESSELVLLPEMPFYRWFPVSPEVDPEVWGEAVAAHDDWQGRFPTLAPAVVLGSRPVTREGRRLNEGYVWRNLAGYQPRHEKYHLPDEEGYWEATWYEPGNGRFDMFEVEGVRLGFLICTDMWFMNRARSYGRHGAHFILTPRATPDSTTDKWLAGGRAAAVVAGSFALSSNRISQTGEDSDQGGVSWIIDPDGELLGATTVQKPFLTLDLDLSLAEQAKRTYPRYVND